MGRKLDLVVGDRVSVGADDGDFVGALLEEGETDERSEGCEDELLLGDKDELIEGREDELLLGDKDGMLIGARVWSKIGATPDKSSVGEPLGTSTGILVVGATVGFFFLLVGLPVGAYVSSTITL